MSTSMNFLDPTFRAQAVELNVFYQASLSEIARSREFDTMAMATLASAHEQDFTAAYTATCCLDEVERCLQEIQLGDRESVVAQVRANTSSVQENLNDWYEQTQALRNSVAGLADTTAQMAATSVEHRLRVSPDESVLAWASQAPTWRDFWASDCSAQSAASVGQFTQLASLAYASEYCAQSVLRTIGGSLLGDFVISAFQVARNAMPDSRAAIPPHSPDVPDGAGDSASTNGLSLLPSRGEEMNPRGAVQQAMERVTDELKIVLEELAALGDGRCADLQAILSDMPQILARVMDKHLGETGILCCLIQNLGRAIGILTAAPGPRTAGRRETLTEMDVEMVQDACTDLRVFIRRAKRRNN